MPNKPIPKIHRKRHCVWLYSAVFSGRISVLAVLLLCGSFLTQPFHEAIAAEPIEPPVEEPETIAADVKAQEEPVAGIDSNSNEVSEEEAEPESSTDSASLAGAQEESEATSSQIDSPEQAESDDVDVVVSDSSVSQEAGTSTTTSAASTETDGESTVSTASSSSQTSGQGSEPETTSTSTTNNTASSTQPTDTAGDVEIATSTNSSSGSDSADDTAAPTDSDGETENPESDSSQGDDSADGDSDSSNESNNSSGGSGGTSDDSINDEEDVEGDTSSSSEETPNEADDVQPIELNFSVNDQNFYQFSKQSCIAVGDGTYHCTERSESDIDRSTAVYADIGASGNLEIFLQTADGEVEQLTDNNRDDTAPHFDPDSMQIVWQRMVDSRYQIVLYDLKESKETQLTFSRTNNMEPKVSKDGIVWQAWDNNDWEIMYFDGTYTDQITDNFAQDVTPAIQDGYIVWSVLGQEEQLARVYSLDNGETMSISGHEGGTIANPRFVLVYDTQFDNGDVITQGFDPETGLAKPISAQPGPNPVNVPQPDTTGETIALIQNKGSSKDEKETLVVSNEGSPDPDFSTSTASTTDTLNLNAPDFEPATSTVDSESEDSATTTPETTEEFELTEFDLVILNDGQEVVSTSTPEEIPMMDRADVDDEVASSTQQNDR